MTDPVRVSAEVAGAFPGVELGFVRFSGVDNRGSHPTLEALKREAEARVRERFRDSELRAEPRIEGWRAAFKRFGTDPTKARPAVDALVRRILGGHEIPSVSPLVDAYLVTEVESLVPFGGWDVEKLCGHVVLRNSPGDEAFLPLGGRDDAFTDEGEVVYADDSKVLTRHWNHRDCDQAKITAASTDILLVCEVLPEAQELVDALGCCGRVAELVVRWCGGSAEVGSLTLIQPG